MHRVEITKILDRKKTDETFENSYVFYSILRLVHHKDIQSELNLTMAR
jgi:hypothetical protein